MYFHILESVGCEGSFGLRPEFIQDQARYGKIRKGISRRGFSNTLYGNRDVPDLMATIETTAINTLMPARKSIILPILWIHLVFKTNAICM